MLKSNKQIKHKAKPSQYTRQQQTKHITKRRSIHNKYKKSKIQHIVINQPITSFSTSTTNLESSNTRHIQNNIDDNISLSMPNHKNAPDAVSPPPELSFKPGQFTHKLELLDLATLQRHYTTAITTTNYEIKQSTKHDNLTAEHYYNPNSIVPEDFTIPVQTYAVRVPAAQSAKFLQTCIKNNYSAAWKCRNILEDAPVSIQPHHAEQSVDFSAAIYADAQVTKTSVTPQNKAYKRILLKREFFPLQYNTIQPFPTHPVDSDEYKTIFNALPDALKEVITSTGAEIVPQTIYFTWQYFSYDEIITSILPSHIVAPTSFTQTGHIIHFNLREEQLPYQYLIGRVACEKINGARVSINKVGMINNVFRNFQAEVLYSTVPSDDNNNTTEQHNGTTTGLKTTFNNKPKDFVCEIKENGYSFQFDFAQVYWNSRLSHEHDRLAQYIHRAWVKSLPHNVNTNGNNNNNNNTTTTIDDDDNNKNNNSDNQNNNKPIDNTSYVLDLFGGVGPFVVPLVKKAGSLSAQHQALAYSNENTAECVVWGNDINPKSSLYMYKNAQKNKLLPSIKDATKEFFQNKAKNNNKQQQTQQTNNNNNTKQTQQKQNSLPLRVFNSCGRELLKLVAKQQMLQVLQQIKNKSQNDNNNNTTQKKLPLFQHFIMNLPANAVEFLDMYVGLYTDSTMTHIPTAFKEEILDNSSQISQNISNYNPTLHFLPPTANNTPNATADNTGIVGNVEIAAQSVLPPHFDEKYANMVQNMDINDNRHHWSTLQAMMINEVQTTTNNTNNNNTSPTKKNTNNNNNKKNNNNTDPNANTIDNLMSITTHTPNDVLIPNPIDIKQYYLLNQNQQQTNNNNSQQHQNNNKNALTVHCYCFVRDAIDPYGEALNLVEGYLGFKLANGEKSEKNEIGIPAQYNEQLISLPQSTLTDSSLTDLSTPIDVHTKQNAYLQTDAYKQYKETQNIFDIKKNHEKTLMNEKLMLMDYCLANDGYFVHHVRNVAPQKDMMCVSFKIPDYILFYSSKMQQFWQSNQNTITDYEKQLFAQQQAYHKKVSYTTFVSNKIIALKQQQQPQNNKEKNFLNELSTAPKDSRPLVHYSDEEQSDNDAIKHKNKKQKTNDMNQ